MLKVFFLVILLPTLIFGEKFHLMPCDEGTLIENLIIDECPKVETCKIKVGDTVMLRGTVIVESIVTSAKLSVEAIKPDGQKVILKLLNDDGCDSVAPVKCPLEPGTYLSSVRVEINGITPEEVVTLKMFGRDQDDKMIACALMKYHFF